MAKRGRFGGFGGGMKDLNNIMKQVQKAQADMAVVQEQLEDLTFEVSVGGGAVTAKANGKMKILGITIDEEVIDPEDKEMLEDLVVAAVNEVLKVAEEKSQEEMKKVTKGMNIPGL